jgi:hypothetical protein
MPAGALKLEYRPEANLEAGLSAFGWMRAAFLWKNGSTQTCWRALRPLKAPANLEAPLLAQCLYFSSPWKQTPGHICWANR